MLSSYATILLVLFAAVVGTADAAASHDISVECDDSTQEICRGTRYFESPSYWYGEGYVGRYNWEFTFVRGLPEGYFPQSRPLSYGIYEYGPTVTIEMDVDAVNCTITVGNETCASCDVCDLGLFVGEAQNATVSADCSNLQTQFYVPDTGAGKIMECEAVLPFFYPLEIPANLTDLPDPSSDISIEGEVTAVDVIGGEETISRGNLRKHGGLFD
ncbi:expressed unknown protein [Seminavis robusta]|uniref:Uncharacterized protein n=1 Tax=Seminavis robusta TaxID=568900 RepID=A0A9N8HKI8_9STRA|nr:expressed unknown protein [Seminavis robusta]|eukprot:Sro947_g223360.1 n/a (215) ;mRNA; f:4739-5383